MSDSSTFRFSVRLPLRVKKRDGTSLDREIVFGWIWSELAAYGLLGVHEGTLLSQEAAEEGLETETWTVDAGEAPRERDWVAGVQESEAQLYFETLEGARQGREALLSHYELGAGEVEEEKPQDWDAQWKATFLGSPDGVAIPPFWRVVPPWSTNDERAPARAPGEMHLKINPGAGFGTGTHETTQLCLRALAEHSLKKPLGTVRVLDFGSGSGILSIGAALLGASVDGVEVDPLAIDNALENARLNGVDSKIRFSRTLPAENEGPYQLVLANILKPVLLEFASKLITRLDRGGAVILSGLIDKDVVPVTQAYTPLIGAGAPRVLELGEWRALVWERS